ncbi:MAG: c-type cytochrome [Chloroflexi bacterium]|nr:c-type cytochrome [Chloroflexota bacterium]
MPALSLSLKPAPLASRALRLAFLALCVVVTAVACAVQASTGGSLSAGTAEEGRKLFADNCVSCHGQRGDRIPTAPLSSREFLESRGDATLAHAVGDGKGVMPAFSKTREGPLGDDQLRSIVAYLNLSAGRQSPTLLAAPGQKIYQEQCTRCHGDKGDRIPVAPLSSADFLASRGDTVLLDAISQGVGVMPGFRQGTGPTLVDEQVKAVIAYLRYNVDATLAQRVSDGRDLYLSKCLSCHGERGDRSPGIALGSAEFLRKTGDDALLAAITDGKGKMPGFVRPKGSTLSAGDASSLLAYMKSWSGLPAGMALAAIGGGGASPAAAAPGPGKDLYTRSCNACHGEKGDKLPTAKLNDPAWLQSKGDPALSQAIAQGKGGMPALGKAKGGALSDDDVTAIVAYLKGLADGGAAPAAAAGPSPAASAVPKPAVPAPAASLAGGTAGPGKDLYARSCSICHGDAGDKLPTAKLSEASFLQSKGDATLAQSIANGKGTMPGFGKEQGGALSADDVTSVVNYLTSLAGGGSASPSASPAASPVPSLPVPSSAPALSGPAHGILPAEATGTTAGPGKDLYTAYCLVCHGVKGDTLPTAKLADAAWLKSRGDDVLTQSIATGKGAMPGFGKEKGGSLGPDDVSSILSYVKILASGAPAPATAAAAPASAAAAAPASASAAPASPTPDEQILIARGDQLYRANCATCHGSGASQMGRLAEGSWLQQRGDRALLRSISDGKSLPGAPNAMPPQARSQGGPLSGEDVTAMLAYLKSVAGIPLTPPPSAEGGPDLALGKDLYGKGCAACHGDKGDKVPSAKLADGAWLQIRGDDALSLAIAGGKGAMPGLGKEKGGALSADDVTAIISFLKSLAGLAPAGQ